MHILKQQLQHRRSKIIATLGPASNSPERIRQLIQAGVNIFRLNMSHGSHSEHHQAIIRIREVAASLNKATAIMADLCGPKIRVGRFIDGGIELIEQQSIRLTVRETMGNAKLIPSQYAALADDVLPGHRILLSDGLMELRVDAVQGDELQCTVIQGGRLSDHQGINLPDSKVSTTALTTKDRHDAQFALEHHVDYLALSFVRNQDDVQDLRRIINHSQQNTGLISKIERTEALSSIDGILQASDGIMIARGDLGVELAPEHVPVIQHELIAKARAANKPVIVATQMLESMIEHIRPTRAEVSDVSNAVVSGSDALMLSAETAVGAHPVASVQMMDRIARHLESSLWYGGTYGSFDMQKHLQQGASVSDALALSTAQLSKDLAIKCIIVLSESGASATAVSSARPAALIIAVTAVKETYHKMSLLWGVKPVWVSQEEFGDKISLARHWAQSYAQIKAGERILLLRWFHHDAVKNTPSITVLSV